jgi:hypothetical protein
LSIELRLLIERIGVDLQKNARRATEAGKLGGLRGFSEPWVPTSPQVGRWRDGECRP